MAPEYQHLRLSEAPPVAVVELDRKRQKNEGRHHNPGGILHGGVLFTLADVGMGAAVFSTLREGERTTAVEVQIRFLHSVVRGRLTAESGVLNRGERIATATADVRDEAGCLVAVASGTFYVSPLRD
jgi:acyl-CoA thioesterase